MLPRARSHSSIGEKRPSSDITDWQTSTEVLHKAVRRSDATKMFLSLELAGFVWLLLKDPR